MFTETKSSWVSPIKLSLSRAAPAQPQLRAFLSGCTSRAVCGIRQHLLLLPKAHKQGHNALIRWFLECSLYTNTATFCNIPGQFLWSWLGTTPGWREGFLTQPRLGNYFLSLLISLQGNIFQGLDQSMVDMQFYCSNEDIRKGSTSYFMICQSDSTKPNLQIDAGFEITRMGGK